MSITKHVSAHRLEGFLKQTCRKERDMRITVYVQNGDGTLYDLVGHVISSSTDTEDPELELQLTVKAR